MHLIRLPLILPLFLVSLPLSAQMDSMARYATERLAHTSATAEWLARYDRFAWISSDSVIAAPDSLKAGLGPEWFVDTLGGVWHAFYGRYDARQETYAIAFHYAGDRPAAMRSSSAPVDTTRIVAIARALANTRARLPAAFAPSGLRLNWYVRRTHDTLEVWCLPAYQPSGVLVFGGEAAYRWDGMGRRFLDSTYSLVTYRQVRPDTALEVIIPAEEFDYPSTGNLFFLLAYHSYFKRLFVRSGRVVTSVFNGPDGPAFVTQLRDTLPAQPPHR